jgi:phosphoenolpyruvate synthase/pyruvate phosphate dikinase
VTLRVLFTCDPLTGDEREIIITANYGIGESVVSAMAEPDTIRVLVDIKDNSCDSRSVKEIKSIEIGSKAKSIKINDSEDGTIEIDNQNQNQCCISKKNAKQLANIGLKVWLARNLLLAKHFEIEKLN